MPFFYAVVDPQGMIVRTGPALDGQPNQVEAPNVSIGTEDELSPMESYYDFVDGEFKERPDMGVSITKDETVGGIITILGAPLGTKIKWPDEADFDVETEDGTGFTFRFNDEGYFRFRLELKPYKDVVIECQVA